MDRRLAPAAQGLVVSASVLGIAFGAAVILVHMGGAILSGLSPTELGAPRSAAPITETQNAIARRRRAAVVDYATKLKDFEAATVREPGTPGINLDAAEARRRQGVLVALVLDCIAAVNQTNLVAAGRDTPTVASGLDWARDCGVGDERAAVLASQ